MPPRLNHHQYPHRYYWASAFQPLSPRLDIRNTAEMSKEERNAPPVWPLHTNLRPSGTVLKSCVEKTLLSPIPWPCVFGVAALWTRYRVCPSWWRTSFLNPTWYPGSTPQPKWAGQFIIDSWSLGPRCGAQWGHTGCLTFGNFAKKLTTMLPLIHYGHCGLERNWTLKVDCILFCIIPVQRWGVGLSPLPGRFPQVPAGLGRSSDSWFWPGLKAGSGWIPPVLERCVSTSPSLLYWFVFSEWPLKAFI